jgi:hypothetical protein
MKKQILFLQLPLLDNDATAPRENFPFAALWLEHALTQHPEGAFWTARPAPAAWDELDNASLLRGIAESGVDAVAFTLCLWNVERAVRIARGLRAAHPGLLLMAGGPEVAEDHPFLLEEPLFDALVIGEGETVFPEILRGIRCGKIPAFANVLRLASSGWTRGSRPPPPADLSAVQVPVEKLRECIRVRPSVYLESARGCPLSCSYCRYHQVQQGVRTLPAAAVARRVEELRAAGAREIRFVDPTFNARADFTELLQRLAAVNADRSLAFFAELRADTLTDAQADLLAKARFSEIEVGVQSTDPKVLRAIRRPADTARVAAGIRRLTAVGVEVTLDLMYGLPEQTLDDVLRSIDWARGLGPGVRIQCMQTLLLPGTDLRAQAERDGGWRAAPLPPYGVWSTPTMSEDDLRRIEALLHDSDDLPADPLTPRFSGYRLSGLFKEQAGRNRRSLCFRGENLNAQRDAICQTVARGIAEEPDTLWQFVLCPEREEPLGLLMAMIQTIEQQPSHLLDRYASAALFGQSAARRIFVRLKAGRTYDPQWREAVENLLVSHFV